MPGRSSASIVAAAETNVGKVRDHNEDSHYIDPELGIFLVCDGMGGHAAGEVASAMAVQSIRSNWSSEKTQAVIDKWLAASTPENHKAMLAVLHDGVTAAHAALLEEAQRDRTKGGMGTTLVGAISIGGDIVFAHCGDSRAYIVRDGIAMQLTEDHTLLARLLAAGVDVDTSAEGARFKSMLTNALGIGHECKVSTFVVPVADGDRFLLCSDGVTEYVKEAEIGEVLCKQPSPARAAQKLVEMALERGGGDNATALVVRVLEAGETARPAEMLKKDNEAIESCPLWRKVTPQQRLRALRIALPRDHVPGEKVPAMTLGDRVAWILVEGEAEQDGLIFGPGALLYPEALLADRPLPDKEGLAVTRSEVRTLALRADDFREICEEDSDLAEALLDALGIEIAARPTSRRTARIIVDEDADAQSNTDPGIRKVELSAPTPVPTARGRISTPPGGVKVPAPSGVPVPKKIPTPVKGVRVATPPRGLPNIELPAKKGSGLFVQASERAEAEAQVDHALSKIAIDDGWGDLNEPEPPAPPPADGEADTAVIEVEAEAPDERDAPMPAAADAADGASDADDADGAETEISIVADEPEPEPEDDEPEITVIRPTRAITADDTPNVAGVIEPKLPRKKSQSD